MRRAYVFRLRPTARQHIALAACLDARTSTSCVASLTWPSTSPENIGKHPIPLHPG
jgi:hypothetical protein